MIGTSYAGEVVNYLVGCLAVLLDLVREILGVADCSFGLREGPFEINEPVPEFALVGFAADFEDHGIFAGIELELVVHGDDGFGHPGESVEFLAVIFVVLLEFGVDCCFLCLEVVAELFEDILNFFLDLEFQGV